MRVLDPGHRYALGHLEGDGAETLTFVKRSGGPVEYERDYSGTTTQEVIRALIDRLKFVDRVLHSDENDRALENLRSALWHLEARAWRRRTQHINRTAERESADLRPPFDVPGIEALPTGADGHIDTTMSTTNYTREQLAEGIDEAHDMLHAVGAGMIRTGCATPDPEAQRVVSAYLDKLDGTGLPCGHRLADLIGGKDAVTKCGACLAERQRVRDGLAETRAIIAGRDPGEGRGTGPGGCANVFTANVQEGDEGT